MGRLIESAVVSPQPLPTLGPPVWTLRWQQGTEEQSEEFQSCSRRITGIVVRFAAANPGAQE